MEKSLKKSSTTITESTTGSLPVSVSQSTHVNNFTVMLIETLGALLLIAGFGSRIIGVLMASIIFSVHLENGFFMNWFGNQKGEGIEYFLLAIGLSLGVVVNGSGAYSLDGLFSKSKKRITTFA